MNWITRSIRNKLLLISGTGTALLLAAALLGLAATWSSIQYFQHQVEAWRAEQSQLKEIQLEAKIQVQEWKNVLLRGSDPAALEKYWTQFEKQEGKVRDGAAALSQQVDDAAAKDTLKQFRRNIKKWATHTARG